MAIVVGARTSANTTATNQAIDMDKVMGYIQDYQTPVNQFFIMNKSASKSVINKKGKFEWHEKSPLARSFVLAAALTGGGTTGTITLAAGDSGILRLGDTIFFDTTGDMVIVYGSADPTTSATVRKIGTGNITTVASGSTARIISPAKTESYTRQTAVTNNADNKYGYLQIGLDSISMSGREDAGDSYTDGESFSDLVKEKMEEIKKYDERKFLYNGAAYLDTSNNIGYSAGAKGVITSNVDYMTGDVDFDEIDGILEKVFAKNDGGQIVGYGGTKFMGKLSKILGEKFAYNTNDIIKVFGGLAKQGNNPELLKYATPWGTVYFVWNPMLEGDIYGNSCLFLNQKHISLRYMKNDSKGSRKWRVEPDVQDLGSGYKQDQMMWDNGYQIKEEIKHGWLLPSELKPA